MSIRGIIKKRQLELFKMFREAKEQNDVPKQVEYKLRNSELLHILNKINGK